MSFFQNWENGFGYVGGDDDDGDGCGDGDADDDIDADLSRFLALVQTYPSPSTACDDGP